MAGRDPSAASVLVRNPALVLPHRQLNSQPTACEQGIGVIKVEPSQAARLDSMLPARVLPGAQRSMLICAV